MTKEEKNIEIIEPSQKIYEVFRENKDKISEILPDAEIELIGSYAVPMKGRKEIDILIISDDVKKSQEKLGESGYSKGPIIGGEAYLKNRNYFVEVELHIVSSESKMPEVYRRLTRNLQNNKEIKEKLEKLKESYEGRPVSEYNKAKDKFIRENNLI